MQVPLVDLTSQFHSIKDEVMSAIEDVLESGQLFLGPHTRAFEQEFAAYCGATCAIGVADGTDALHLVFRAAGLGPGDEIITVSHTFIATIEAIEQVGARPVLVDINPESFTMAIDQIERHITPRTRAIVPVHLYGRMADMDAIMAIAEEHGLLVIEDASQAHGAVDRHGRRAGSIGHAATFSFYYAKNLGAYGEMGAVTTSDPEIDRRIRLLRTHGEEQRYEHAVLGYNSRPDEVQCAVLRVKLRRLDDWNTLRRQHAATYDRLLRDLPLRCPELISDGAHVYHQYVVRSERRDEVRDWLTQRGIGTGIHYPIPVHLQAATRHLGYAEGDLPHTEAVAREILSLPMYPEITAPQLDQVVSALREATVATPSLIRR